MTITQRIELRRLGYTKEEIAELAEMEKQPMPQEGPEAPETEQPESPVAPEAPEAVQAETGNSVQEQLLNAINTLTLALQNKTLIESAQPIPDKIETSESIFESMLKG